MLYCRSYRACPLCWRLAGGHLTTLEQVNQQCVVAVVYFKTNEFGFKWIGSFHAFATLYLRTDSSMRFDSCIKGQCREIFCFWFFHESVSPLPQSIPLGLFQFFCENSRRYSQVMVHHRYQKHRWQILPPVSLVLLIPMANLPPVSTIVAANLPPVSMTPVEICHRSQRHQRQICHRCHCQYQTAETLKWTWRQKSIYK